MASGRSLSSLGPGHSAIVRKPLYPVYHTSNLLPMAALIIPVLSCSVSPAWLILSQQEVSLETGKLPQNIPGISIY